MEQTQHTQGEGPLGKGHGLYGSFLEVIVWSLLLPCRLNPSPGTADQGKGAKGFLGVKTTGTEWVREEVGSVTGLFEGRATFGRGLPVES